MRKSALPTVMPPLLDNKGARIPPLKASGSSYRWIQSLNKTVASYGDEFDAILRGVFPNTVEDVPAVPADPENNVAGTPAVLGSESLETNGTLIIRKIVAEQFVNIETVSTLHAVDENGDRKTTKSHGLPDRKLRQMNVAIQRKLYKLFFSQDAVGTMITEPVHSIVKHLDPTSVENRGKKQFVFNLALDLIRERLPQSGVRNQERLRGLHTNIEMRHGSTIDTAMHQFYELYREMESAGIPVTEKQRRFDVENRLLSFWNKESATYLVVNPDATAASIWDQHVLRQTSMQQANVLNGDHAQQVGRIDTIGQGERGLHARRDNEPRPRHDHGGCDSSSHGCESGDTSARAFSAWATSHGKLMSDYGKQCPVGTMLRTWYDDKSRASSQCYHRGCDGVGHPAALCDGYHNPRLRSFGDIRDQLKAQRRDANGDTTRPPRATRNDGGRGSGRSNDRGRNDMPRNRRYDHRGQQDRDRDRTTDRSQQRRHRDDRRDARPDRNARRNPRASQHASIAREEDSRGALNFDEPGYPPQEQHAYGAMQVLPGNKGVRQGVRILARHKGGGRPKTSSSREAPRKAPAPTCESTDTDDVKPVRRHARTRKKGSKCNEPFKIKAIVKRSALSAASGSKNGTRVQKRAKITLSRMTPTKKVYECKCGFVSESNMIWARHKTCPMAPDFPGKQQAIIKEARSKEKRRRLRNAQLKMRRAKAALAECIVSGTDDDTKLKRSSAASAKSVPPTPTLPPTTGGKGPWPPANWRSAPSKPLEDLLKPLPAGPPERSSSSSESDASSQDREVRSAQKDILKEDNDCSYNSSDEGNNDRSPPSIPSPSTPSSAESCSSVSEGDEHMCSDTPLTGHFNRQ